MYRRCSGFVFFLCKIKKLRESVYSNSVSLDILDCGKLRKNNEFRLHHLRRVSWRLHRQ